MKNVRFLQAVLIITAVSLAAVGTAHAQLPAPWASSDVGSVDVPGSAVEDNGVFSVTGSGSIWDPDTFHFLYQTIDGDFEIVALLDSLQNVNEWTKGGLMVRGDLSDKSKNILIFASPDYGVNMQARVDSGGSTKWLAGPGGSPYPIWMKLTKVGDLITGYVSTDGATWAKANEATLHFKGDMLVGMAVASTFPGVTAVGIFTDVTVTKTTGIENYSSSERAQDFSLSDNYPNPFNPTTSIEFSLPKAVRVTLTIFDVRGRKMATLVDKHMQAGLHHVDVDASAFASGIYLYRLQAGEHILTKKMMLVK